MDLAESQMPNGEYICVYPGIDTPLMRIQAMSQMPNGEYICVYDMMVSFSKPPQKSQMPNGEYICVYSTVTINRKKS